MFNNKKQFGFIALSCVLGALLGLVLPGMTLAGVTTCTAIKTADVVAIDHAIFFNRMGAYNPAGMIYALRRDVVDDNIENPSPIGSAVEAEAKLMGGHSFNLRPGKRPRPLVLRVNAGECLHINFQNLLKPVAASGEQPATRSASIHAAGMQLVGNITDDGSHVGANNTSGQVDPGESTTYKLYAQPDTENIFLITSGNVISGEGDGASVSMGLFGSINVEPAGAEYYRSQLTRQEMDWATTGTHPTGHPIINYDATYPAAAGSDLEGLPIINVLQGNEIVHSDLRAIITGPGRGNHLDKTYPPSPVIAPNDLAVPGGAPQAYGAKGDRPREEPFREFSIFFHDEVFAHQAFPEFEDEVLLHTLHSTRDAFGINYGIGGIGSEILANRKGLGPQWDCVDCKYEEFFLTSWVLGDSAMNVDVAANASAPKADVFDPILGIANKAHYPDDPSNVEHSYIGDHVKMRNVHAGPKEHHIFHLHSHQWVFTPDEDQSVYLDSQAVGPGSSYNYEIAYNGSGNRNQTPGDAIYHCHFYPHFAQGMWSMWRNHDVFEQGTPMNADGTVVSGARAYPDGEIVAGTPIPAVVPIPTLAMAPMPAPVHVEPIVRTQFADKREIGSNIVVEDTDLTKWVDGVEVALTNVELAAKSPGYPFIIAGTAGHRPPNPVLDHAVIGGEIQDGGLHDPTNRNNSRHVIKNGTVGEIHTNRLDMRKVLATVEPEWYPEDGNEAEKLGIAFHSLRTHDSVTPEGTSLKYVTNGRGPVHGAPFADPCVDDQGKPAGNWGGQIKDHDHILTENGNTVPARLYKGADIELDLVFNKLGEHYPQARMIALWEDVDAYVSGLRAPEPLFFRANSRECIEFWQTNLLPHEYELDDFQVRTPTDVVGQHIHLVKFDVTSADGSGNGWNYEDAGFAPGEVIERIEAIHHYCAQPFDVLTNIPNPAVCVDVDKLVAVKHPVFTGPEGLGATTVIQRWYADETMSMTGIDRTLRTVYTHDHYGPSTHQQVGLYAGLLIEPEDSEWFDMVSGVQMGDRDDGGPTSWRANIHTNLDAFGQKDLTQSLSYREFMYEFADFALGYKPGPLGTDIHVNTGDDRAVEAYDIPHNFVNRDLAINPPAKATIGLPFVLKKAKHCPGIDPAGPPSQTCPEAVSADDPGSFVVNYRNESVIHRIRHPKPVGNSDVDNYPFINTVTFPGVGDADYDADGNIDLADVDVSPLAGTVYTFPGVGDTDVNYDGYVDAEDTDVPPLANTVEGFPGVGDTDHDGDGEVDLADTDVYPFINTVTFPEQGSNDIDHNGDGAVNASETESADCLNPSDFSKKREFFDPETGITETHYINGCQAAGLAGDLGHVFRSDIERANPKLNTALGNSPYPPLTGGIRPGDPFTPLMQAYENDRVQFRFMVGAHEEGHVESIYGVKWLFDPNVKDSGWRNGQMAGISEHFEFELDNLSPVKGDAPFMDYMYTFDTSSDGFATGVWGLIRSYQDPGTLTELDGNLELLPNNHKGTTSFGDVDKSAFNGVCPKEFLGKGKNKTLNPDFVGDRNFSITAVRAKDVLPGGTLVYNSRLGAFPSQQGPLHDPNALMYVFTNDLANGMLKDGVPVEPPVLRAAAGECIKVKLINGLPTGNLDDADAFNVVPMVIEKFNLNEVQVSSEVGLHPQLVTYDVATDEGVNAGFNVSHWAKRTVAPGDAPVTYKWYAGEVAVVENPGGTKPFKLQAIPIEFGATNLVSPDPLEHSAKGLIASLIIEPKGSTWQTDQELCYPMASGGKGKKGSTVPDPAAECLNGGEIAYHNSRSAATVTKADGTVFREMVLNFQDDVQLRDANGNTICPIAGAGEVHGEGLPNDQQFVCSGPEDPEDSGNKAVNYKTEPAWFRMGHDPGAPFGHTRQIDFTDLLSNSITAGSDPETPILTAKAGQEVRFRVLESGGHPRNHVFAVHGHLWQKTPYVTATEDYPGSWGDDESSVGSESIGDNVNSEHYGTQAGHGPQNHFDMVLPSAGGAGKVSGDYLWRNQASVQFDAGHWGLLRVLP